MLAMKSPAETSAAIRGDAAAIASTDASPAASSICASIPVRPTGTPHACSTWPSRMSSQAICAGEETFGRTSVSTAPGALSMAAITSRWAHCVVAPLTRTARSLPSIRRPPARRPPGRALRPSPRALRSPPGRA